MSSDDLAATSGDVNAIATSASAATPKGWFDSITGGNQFMSAGLGVMAVGAGLAVARQSVRRAAGFAKHRMLVTMEIPSKDKSYLWFLHWMSSHQSRRSHHFAVETLFKQHDNGSASTTFSLVPGPGKHLLKYRGAYIQVDRQRDGKMMDLSTGSPWETVTLTTLYRDRGIFPQLLKEAQESAMKMQEGKTVIYSSIMTDWRPFGKPRLRRSLNSVVLDTGIKERVVADVKDFLKSGSWYRDRGIPYRRGYLLHGPPGSGKSSFIYALAGELEYNICVLNLSERGLTDDRLNHLLSNIPDRSIMLLEDIDAAFSGRSQSSEGGYSRSNVTFSGLLNALDGVASAEERIIFMTTNHEDQLDPALIRPGRVDIKELLDDASDTQITEMFLRFYEGESKRAQEFLRSVRKGGKGVSTAQLQGMFVYNKGEPQKSIDMAHLLTTDE
ncbi:Mitochondrial chaperone BCS1 [Taphrina deformans PYCC 5710]|uniref:Mitochondrial chaperone BCS1 n=1 Tax=Taphrina deformans (strain PYCC 5710 / ATCC 11124 / CBS 356.35 / IMI 108563 / JCM 9778 / NBRC 8474) TaxID=1097556 RepID=R4X6U1_TAPDE|nr:Mitochondrial chaperone BCS1 [Taphrina deformans PYCC 5710]|eukprot:CCG80927.1 Mitochondrial chaperone BCS1 [Taphrina deformans PYCC 5710]